jgi:hypothetical protein
VARISQSEGVKHRSDAVSAGIAGRNIIEGYIEVSPSSKKTATRLIDDHADRA